MERKIGEIFEYNGEWYQCVKGNTCDECSFNKSSWNCSFDGTPYCSDRSDEIEVVFKKLEKVGEPVTEKGKAFQCLNALKTECTGCVFLNSEQGCDKDHYIDGPCPGREIWVEIKQIKEDMETNEGKTGLDFVAAPPRLAGDKPEHQLNLKPFDLEAAKLGKPVCTRDGRKARIICFDVKGNLPMAVAVELEEDIEIIYTYPLNGIANPKGNQNNDLDLMMLPEKKEGWVNVYYDNDASSHRGCRFIYDTKERAVKEAGSAYITTVKISWEE